MRLELDRVLVPIRRATGLGVVGTWILIALDPSYYVRRRFSVRHWKVAHRLIAIGLLLALVHSLGGG